MFTQKEIAWIVIVIIVFEFIIIFPLQKDFNPIILAIPPIIIFTSIIAKKIAANFFNIKIEHEIWKIQRWGFYKRSHIKKPIHIGLIFPFIISIISLGLVKMLLFLQFKVDNVYEKRILKERGFKRKSEINDSDAGFTAAWGFYSLILLAFIGAVFRFPELVKYSIYYSMWNLLPIANLDGSKLFYGTITSWIFILIINILGLIILV